MTSYRESNAIVVSEKIPRVRFDKLPMKFLYRNLPINFRQIMYVLGKLSEIRRKVSYNKDSRKLLSEGRYFSCSYVLTH